MRFDVLRIAFSALRVNVLRSRLTVIGVAVLLRNSFGWDTTLGPTSIAFAFLFAAGVGILFGVWPARRASSLDPIEALRHE